MHIQYILLLIVINYKLIMISIGNVYFSILSIIQLYSLLKRYVTFKKFFQSFKIGKKNIKIFYDIQRYIYYI